MATGRVIGLPVKYKQNQVVGFGVEALPFHNTVGEIDNEFLLRLQGAITGRGLSRHL